MTSLELISNFLSFDMQPDAYNKVNPLGSLAAEYPRGYRYEDVDEHEIASADLLERTANEAGLLSCPGITWHDDTNFWPWSALLIIENPDLVIASRASENSIAGKTCQPNAGDLVILNIHKEHRVKPAGRRQYHTHKRLTCLSLGFKEKPTLAAIKAQLARFRADLKQVGICYRLKPRT